MKKRMLSLFLTLALCLSLLPVPVLAAGGMDISDWLEPELPDPKVGWGKDGSYDISWYVSAPTGETSFILEDAADLAGLAVIVNGTYQVTGDEVWNDVSATMGGSYAPDEKLQDSFQGKTVTLAPGVTFDLGGRLWIPIGYTSYFQGTFDGNSQNGTRITNMTIQSSGGSVGLFGQGIFAHIQNVAVEEASITAKLSQHDAVGGIVGRLTGREDPTGTGSVENCSFSGSINTTPSNIDTYVGGIIGVSSFDGTNSVYSDFTVENCVSYASITGSAAYIGGIAGWNGGDQANGKDNTIQNCQNHGSINTSGGSAGGIVGRTDGTIQSCQNFGDLILTGGTSVGGVAGEMNQCTISDCTNQGKISITLTRSYTGDGTGSGSGDGSADVTVDEGSSGISHLAYAGGVVGLASLYAGDLISTIQNCHNRAAVTCTCLSPGGSAYVGGILGEIQDSSSKNPASIQIQACSNTGGLTAEGFSYSRAGGLLGRSTGGITVSQSYNAGGVTAETTNSILQNWGAYSQAGGLAAYATGGSFSNCYNTGAVHSSCSGIAQSLNPYAGGLVGQCSEAALENCYNAGGVASSGGGSKSLGGIAGSAQSGTTLTNCVYWDECVTGATNDHGTSKTANQMTEDHLWSGSKYMNLDPSVWTKQYNDLSDETNLIGYLPVLISNRQSPDPYLTRTVKADSSGSLTITPRTASVSVGGTASLTASGASGDIRWFSRDESVATVSGSGTSATVTGVGPGTVEIIAAIPGSASTNDVYATAVITVNETISAVSIGGLTAPVQGETPVGTVTVPADGGYTAGSVSWKEDGSSFSGPAFQVGKTYTAAITLTPELYRTFADSVSVTLTGTPDGAYGTPTVTKNSDGTLTVTVTFSPVAHKHSWDTANWKRNEIYHWNDCVNEGCTITKDSQKPGYDRHMDGDNGICLVCGADIGYTVTLNLNYEGASAPTVLRTNVRGKLENALPVPTRENYSFEGWFTEPSGGEPVTDDYTYDSSKTLYAHWSNVTISYVVIQDLQTPEQKENVRWDISLPDHVNYALSGNLTWKENGKVLSTMYGNPAFQYDLNTPYIYTAEFKLTAQGKFTFTNDVQVTLDGVSADAYDEAGSGIETQLSADRTTLTVTVTFDPTVHKHSVTETTQWTSTATQHYHRCTNPGCPCQPDDFNFGMVDLENHEDSDGNGKCDICNLQIGYQVVFCYKLYEGVDYYERETLYTGMDGRLKELPDEPTLTGWIFDGWYTQQEGGEKLDINTVYTSHNNIFYAHWRQDPITQVTVSGLTAPAQGELPNGSISVPDGGHYAGSYVSWYNSAGNTFYGTFQSGERYTASISLSGDSGYYFGDSAIEGDVTNQVAVNLPGLSNTAYTSITVNQNKSGSKYSITIKVTFKAVDHTHQYNNVWEYDALQHWRVCTAANCPNEGNKVELAPHTGNPGQTCSVCGRQIGYQITFYYNDGSSSSDSAYTDTDGGLTQLPVVTHYQGADAYRFLGWFTKADDSGEKVDENTVYSQNTVLYAHWEKIVRYSISLDYNAGGYMSSSASEAKAEASVTLTITPYSGYELASLSVTWTGGKIPCTPVSGTSNQYTFQMPAGTVTVEAVFAQKGSAFAIQNKPAGTIDTSTQPFTLTASGGTGSGPVTWQSSDEAVATVASTGANTALVTIKGPGTVTIAAWREDAPAETDSLWLSVAGKAITKVTITGLTSPVMNQPPVATASVPGEDSSLYYVLDGVVTWEDLAGNPVITFQEGERYTASMELKALNGASFADLSSFPVELEDVTEGTYTDISARRLDGGTLQVVVTFGPVGHLHNWDWQDYKYNEIYHWQTCTDPNCTVTTTPEKHTGSAGGACRVCGGRIGYAITLDYNDGTGAASIYYTNTDGKVANLPSTLRRDGYVFAGWFTAPQGGTQVTADTLFPGPGTIYAHWAKEAEYTITVAVDPAQGTVTPSVASAPEGTTVTLNVSVAQGWVLQSLTVTKAGGGTVNVVNSQFTMPAENVTVTAVFVQEGTTLTISGLPEGPIYQGDRFQLTASMGAASWSTSDPGVATVSAGGFVTVVGAGYVEITAARGSQTAKVAFTALGPDIDSVTILDLTAPVAGAPSSQQISVPEDAPYQAATTTGFGGSSTLDVQWTDEDGNKVTAFEINQVYTVTIKLQPEDNYAFADGEITVSLDSLQESAYTDLKTEKQLDGTLNIVVTFRATDHLHSWDPNWSFTALYHWHACLNEDCPLLPPGMDSYAHHVDGDRDGFCDACNALIGYLISFDAAGGFCEISSARTDTTGRLVSLPTPVRNEYAFTGWYTSAYERVTTSTVFTTDTVIHAGWSSLIIDEPPVAYPVEVEESAHGAVVASPREAYPGNTVTLTAIPDQGYVLDWITVTDERGSQVELVLAGANKFTFRMPDRSITVQASFVPAGQAGGLPFTDVPAGSWYYQAVRYVYENGLMSGTGEYTFSPDATTSRSMIATILWRLAGSPVVNYAMDYTDVDPESWYGEAVRWASSQGVVAGYGDGTFGPDDPITREQLAVMLYRVAQLNGKGFTGAWAFPLDYADAELVSGYAYEAMCWITMHGVISGMDGNLLSPQGHATRAQAAVMLMQFGKLLP